MNALRLALLGYGTVGRALHQLLERNRAALAAHHGITFVISGIASRRMGWIANAKGLERDLAGGVVCGDFDAWLPAAGADVVFEAIALEPHTGEPALGYLASALRSGAHAISANKGPVVHGYRALSALAANTGRVYRFESAVMDGAPLFSLVRNCLPLCGLTAVRGVFTSTATVVLEAVERGGTMADGVAHAQALGIAESNPSYDMDGWDSAVKLCAVANVLLLGDLRPGDVVRTGIGNLTEHEIRAARAEGAAWRLVGNVSRAEDGSVCAHVAPERLTATDVLGLVSGTTLVTHLAAAMFPGGLTITSRDPDPTTTAYGMLADFVGVCGT
ncbi:homoserine dehydrogenase [soil metagenome]